MDQETREGIIDVIVQQVPSMSGVELRRLVEAAMEAGYTGPAPAAAPAIVPRMKLRSRERSLNSRGKGSETYRLLVSPDGSTGWADQHPSAMLVTSDWSSHRGFRAADRRCSTTLEVDSGLIYISIVKDVPSRGTPTYYAGITEHDGRLKEQDERCPIEHVGTKPGNVHVLKIRASGERVEVGPSASSTPQTQHLLQIARMCARMHYEREAKS